jgi:hypothetical protein
MSDNRSSDESRSRQSWLLDPRAGRPAVQHVEQISYDQNDSGPEEPAESEQQAATDINRHPTKVRMFGLICPRASQRTIASMIRWPALPMLAPNI